MSARIKNCRQGTVWVAPRFLIMMVLCSVAAGITTVAAQDEEAVEPNGGFFVGTEVLGLYNITNGPRAAVGATVWYQRPIIDRRGPLWDSARIEVGLSNRWAPVFNETKAYLYLEPVAALDITASVAYQVQYDELIGGGYYRLTSYDEDPTEEIPDREITQGGVVARIAPRFKFAMAGFVAAHTIQISYVDYSALSKEDDKFDYYLDTGGGIDEVLNERDLWVENSTFLLYEVAPDFLLGLNSVLDAVPDADRRNYQFNLAGMFTRTFGNDWNINVVGIAGTYLSHRWLEGEPNVTAIVEFSRPLREN